MVNMINHDVRKVTLATKNYLTTGINNMNFLSFVNVNNCGNNN